MPECGIRDPYSGNHRGRSFETIARRIPENGSRLDHFFVMTPHATLGPPLTPDFGSPVMP